MAKINNAYAERVYSALRNEVKGFNLSKEQFFKKLENPSYIQNVYNALRGEVRGFNLSKNRFSAKVYGIYQPQAPFIYTPSDIIKYFSQKINPESKEHKIGFIKGFARNFIASAFKTMGGLHELLLGIIPHKKGKVIEKGRGATGTWEEPTELEKTIVAEKEIANKLRVEPKNEIEKVGYEVANGLANLAITIPLDVKTGEIIGSVAVKVIPKLKPIILGVSKPKVIPDKFIARQLLKILPERIPAFALGWAGREALRGLEEGKGVKEKLELAVEEGARNLFWGTVYGSVKRFQIPIMTGLGAGQAAFEALKEGRKPTPEEIKEGAISGFSYGVIFQLLPILSKLGKRAKERMIIKKIDKEVENAIKEGDFEKVKETVDNAVKNENLSQETKEILKTPEEVIKEITKEVIKKPKRKVKEKVEKPKEKKITFKEIEEKDKLAPQLRAMNYPESVIERMSLETAKDIVEKNIPYEKVSVLPDGSYKVIEKKPSEVKEELPKEVKVEEETKAIPKELEPLAREARKYKNAGEFVKAIEDNPIIKDLYLKKLGLVKPEDFKLFAAQKGYYSSRFERFWKQLQEAKKGEGNVLTRQRADYLFDKYKDIFKNFYNQAVKQAKPEIEPETETKPLPKTIDEFIKENYKGISENQINSIKNNVDKIINKYSRYLKSPQTDKEELKTISFIGLQKALETYKKEKGASLITHIRNNVVNEIRNWMAENEQLIKIPSTNLNKVRQAIKQLEQEGKEITPENISKITKIRIDTVEDIIRAKNIEGIEVKPEEGISEIEKIPSKELSPEARMIKKQREKEALNIKEKIERLPEDEKEFMNNYIQQPNLDKLAQRFNISKEEAMEKYQKILEKITKETSLEEFVNYHYEIGKKGIKEKEERGSFIFDREVKREMNVEKMSKDFEKQAKKKTRFLRNLLDRVFTYLPQLKDYPELRNEFRKREGYLYDVRDYALNKIPTMLWGNLNSKAEINASVNIIFQADRVARLKARIQELQKAVEWLEKNPKENKEKIENINEEIRKLAEDFKNENQKFKDMYDNASLEVQKSVLLYKNLTERVRENLVEVGILRPEQNFDFYAPHYILKYLEGDILSSFYYGFPRRFKKFKPGFARKYTGSPLPYLETPEALLSYFAQAKRIQILWDFINEIGEKYDYTKNWTKEDYIKYIKDNFSVDEIREKLLQKNISSKKVIQSLENLRIDQLKRMAFPNNKVSIKIGDKEYSVYYPSASILDFFKTEKGTVGVKRTTKVYILPKEIATTLDNFYSPFPIGLRWINRATSYWKAMAIYAHLPSFHLNNIIGDTSLFLLQHPEPWKAFRDIEIAIQYITTKPSNYTGFLKELHNFIIDHAVLEGLMVKQEVWGTNRISLFRMLNNVSAVRESLLRIAQASYNLRNLYEGKGEWVRKQYPHIDTEGLNTKDALGKIARETLIDYSAVNRIFRQYFRGLAVPFGTFYIKGSELWWNFQFSRKWWIALLGALGPAIGMAGLNFLDEKRRKLFLSLPENLQALPVVVLKREKNPDGSISVLIPQYPPYLFVGGYIYPSLTNTLFKMVFEDLSPKEAAKFFLKNYTGTEAKKITFLLNPILRFFSGILSGKDVITKRSIYPVGLDPQNLSDMEIAKYWTLYFLQLSTPPLTLGLENYVKGLPVDVSIKDFIESFAGKRMLGIYDIMPGKGIAKNLFTEKEINSLPENLRKNLDKLGWEDLNEVNLITGKVVKIINKVLEDNFAKKILTKNHYFEEEINNFIETHNKQPKEFTRKDILRIYEKAVSRYMRKEGRNLYFSILKEQFKTDKEKVVAYIIGQRFVNKAKNPFFINKLATIGYERAQKNSPEYFYFGKLKEYSYGARFIKGIKGKPKLERAVLLGILEKLLKPKSQP